MSSSINSGTLSGAIFKANPMPNFKKIHQRHEKRRVKVRPPTALVIHNSFAVGPEKHGRGALLSGNLSPSTVSSSAHKPSILQRQIHTSH